MGASAFGGIRGYATPPYGPVADLVYFIWVLRVWYPAVQGYLQAATAYKAELAGPTNGGEHAMPQFPVSPDAPEARPAGVLDRLFKQVQRIKISAGFAQTIWLDLGIVGTVAQTDYPYPDFKLGVEQGAVNQVVSVGFPKHGHDGVWIESRRSGGGAWEFLAVSNKKPYVDKRVLLAAGVPELREFRLRWWGAGEPNGEWSPVKGVTVV